MRKKRSDLSQYSRTARRMRIRRAKESVEDRETRLAACRERQALSHAMLEQIICVQYNHFTPDQFESNRADGLVKLKPNAVPTIFYQLELTDLCKAPAENEKVLKRRRRCSVAGCKSKYKSRKNTDITFPLPDDKHLRKKWLRKIPTDLSSLKKPVICMKHFKEECIVRTEQVLIDGEVYTIERSCPMLKPDAVPSIFPKHTTNNRAKKRRRTSRKSCIGDGDENEGMNEALQLDMIQKQVATESIANMLEVDLYPHMYNVDVKQEPEDYETEELDSCANEESVKDPIIAAGCNVIIKEEPDLELDVDVVENSLPEEPFKTSICTNNIKEEPESTLEVAELDGNVNKFTEVFVSEWCPPGIKQEET